MGRIYSGLIAEDGYLFITNDTFGTAEDSSAIVKVNKFCGALIVTAMGNILIRVREILDKSFLRFRDIGDGLSIDLAEAIVASFNVEFQKEQSFKYNPLPFLLLLVGYNLKGQPHLEHIFVRNRVVNIVDKGDAKEYTTAFEIRETALADNLFYGHSALIQYLSQQLPLNALNLDIVKLFAYFSMVETQNIDKSLSQGIRMATVSMGDGFRWIMEEESDGLSDMARNVDTRLSEELFWFLPSI